MQEGMTHAEWKGGMKVSERQEEMKQEGMRHADRQEGMKVAKRQEEMKQTESVLIN